MFPGHNPLNATGSSILLVGLGSVWDNWGKWGAEEGADGKDPHMMQITEIGQWCDHFAHISWIPRVVNGRP